MAKIGKSTESTMKMFFGQQFITAQAQDGQFVNKLKQWIIYTIL